MARPPALVEPDLGHTIPQKWSSSAEAAMRVPTVVTTNYDLLLEFAISARSDVDLTYAYSDYSGLRNIFGRELTARFAMHYLKLHGSINWWGKNPGDRATKEMARAAAIVTFNTRDYGKVPNDFGVEVLLPRDVLRRFPQ